MIDGIGKSQLIDSSTFTGAEYQEVIDQLTKLFPDKTPLEIETAIFEYVDSHGDNESQAIDPEEIIAHISQVFSQEITSRTADEIKKEWENFTAKVDTGVGDLASLFGDYDPEETAKTGRAYLILLWQQLQGELEDAVVDESVTSAEADKTAQKKSFDEYIDERIEILEKQTASEVTSEVLQWGGLASSLLGAVIGAVTAVAALVMGVIAAVDCVIAVAGIIGAIPSAGTSLGATFLLFGKATLCFGAAAALGTAALASFGLAAGTAGTLIAKHAFGDDWSLGEDIGRGIAKLLETLGTDVDEEEFAKWSAIITQFTLTGVAVVGSVAGAILSLGITSSSAISAIASFMNVIAALVEIGNGVVLAVKTGVDFDYAMAQADLLELQALLEQLGESRQMAQELMDAILSKIFEAMRTNVAESTDLEIKNLEQIAGMNLLKG